MRRRSTKDLRKTNEYNFETYVLEGLRMVYEVTFKKRQGLYTIRKTQFGSIDIYPKADKLMFHDSGKWINRGAEWLCNNL